MAGRTGSKRHVHKYFRLDADMLWHCGDARCTHFMPSNMPPPIWKDSICWGCGKTIELTPDNMMSSHPVCNNCPPFIHTVNPEKLDEVTKWVEAKEKEARAKRLAQSSVPAEEVESSEEEKEYKAPEERLAGHLSDCAGWLMLPCDCGFKDEVK